jgi:alkanesulfonate monooxygenase SsuD/methylene tetrahydromethanopterin reductase-like flavin-dependent oxidoreductase (luciferase family)
MLDVKNIDFGFIIRPSSFGLPISASELPEYNRRCIQTLSPNFTSIWMEDHLQWGEDDTLEIFSTLSFLAAQFPSFKVGTLVLCQSYRNPALIAKMAANLQFLSGGRFILGIGAGWKTDEYLAYGYRVPSNEIRWEQLEEAILVVRSMWGDAPATFIGQHYQIQQAYCEPKPVPTIPLLIGGGGEKKTLALVAQHADWWNYNSCTVEEYAHKVAILKSYCEKLGRDPEEIRLTYSGNVSVSEDPDRVVRSSHKHYIAGNSAEVIQELERFCEIGVSHFMVRFTDFSALGQFMSAVAPHFL